MNFTSRAVRRPRYRLATAYGLTFLLIAAAASLSLSVGGADARDILAKKTNRRNKNRNKNSGSSRCSSSMPSGAKAVSSGGSSGSYAYGSMAGGKFKKVKAKSMKACFDACVDTANCETFVYKKKGKRCKVETSGGKSKVMYCVDKASKKKGELVGVVTAAKEAQLIGGDTGGVGGQAGAYTWTQVAAHDTPGDCWTVLGRDVYDITSFAPTHPGGRVINGLCGRDATKDFSEHSSAERQTFLGLYERIGEVEGEKPPGNAIEEDEDDEDSDDEESDADSDSDDEASDVDSVDSDSDDEDDD